MSFAWVLEEDAAEEEDEDEDEDEDEEGGGGGEEEEGAGSVGARKEGQLRKRGRHWPYNWVERTFVLTDTALLQQRVANNSGAASMSTKGTFGPGCSVTQEATGRNTPSHCFSVGCGSGQKRMLLRASSAVQQEEWVTAFGAVLGAVGRE